MDTIGLNASEINLCRRIFGYANNYWIRKDDALAGAGVQEAANVSCRALQKLFSKIENLDNFFLLVAAERIMCQTDLKHFQSTQQDIPNPFSQDIILKTLQEGVRQMDEISDKLVMRSRDVDKFHLYSSGTQTIKNDHDKEGLPKDGIRKLLLSHKTRLQNKNKGMDGASQEEQGLIWRRHRNLQVAEHLYIAMQREALGIDQSKDQGLQR